MVQEIFVSPVSVWHNYLASYRSSNSHRKRATARAMCDLTVPRSTCRMAAISSSVWSGRQPSDRLREPPPDLEREHPPLGIRAGRRRHRQNRLLIPAGRSPLPEFPRPAAQPVHATVDGDPRQPPSWVFDVRPPAFQGAIRLQKRVLRRRARFIAVAEHPQAQQEDPALFSGHPSLKVAVDRLWYASGRCERIGHHCHHYHKTKFVPLGITARAICYSRSLCGQPDYCFSDSWRASLRACSASAAA